MCSLIILRSYSKCVQIMVCSTTVDDNLCYTFPIWRKSILSFTQEARHGLGEINGEDPFLRFCRS